MKSNTYYAKVSVLSVLLVLISYYLTTNILEIIQLKAYLSPPLNLLLLILVLFYALMVTYSLLVGTWNSAEQYIFGPTPVVFGILLIVFPLGAVLTVLIGTLAFSILGINLFMASALKNQLISFNPRFVFRYTAKSIVLVFSLVSIFLVVGSTGLEPEINIGTQIGKLTSSFLEKQISNSTNSQLDNLNPQEMEILKEYGINQEDINVAKKSGLLDDLINTQVDVGKTVSNQINEFIEPYKRFVNPVMGILLFSILQFVGYFSKVLFFSTIDFYFWLGKKVGFFKIHKETVEKEVLTF